MKRLACACIHFVLFVGFIRILLNFAGMILGLLTTTIPIIRFCVTNYAIRRNSWNKSDLFELLDAVIMGITVLVVAIPEGLPLAVTLALAVAGRVRTLPLYTFILPSLVSAGQCSGAFFASETAKKRILRHSIGGLDREIVLTNLCCRK